LIPLPGGKRAVDLFLPGKGTTSRLAILPPLSRMARRATAYGGFVLDSGNRMANPDKA